jgi:hypothetical protein
MYENIVLINVPDEEARKPAYMVYSDRNCVGKTNGPGRRACV